MLNQIDKQHRYRVIILLLILVLTRVIYLDSVPSGLHIDEAGMAYDAWSLANFGVDRYLNSFPVYFINFGGGQSVLYGYLASLFIRLFGYSVFVIRLPGVLLSFISALTGYAILKKTSVSNWLIELFLFIFVVSPYFIMQSRFGLDCNLMMGMSSLVIFSVDFLMQSKKISHVVMAGLLSGLFLYSYALTYIVLPLFLILFFVYDYRTRKTSVKRILIYGLTLFLVSSPLILMVFVNQFDLGSKSIMFMTIPQLPKFRGSEISFANIPINIRLVIKSILFYDWLPYNSVKEYLTLYWIAIPFVMIGTINGGVKLVRNLITPKYSTENVVWLFSLSVFSMGLLLGGDYANTNKLNGIFFAIILLLIYGIRDTYYGIKSFGEKTQRYFIISIVLVYTFLFVSFANFYYFEYPAKVDPQHLFSYTYEDELKFLRENALEYRKVYIEENYHGYIYYVLSDKISPYDFKIELNGEKNYKNIHFYLPHETEKGSVHIVRKTNTEFLERSALDMFKVIEFEHYYVIYD